MKKRLIICIAFTLILSILFIQRNEIISFAESTLFLDTTLNSQGKIVYAGTVLFDSADLGTLKDGINDLATVVDDQTVPKYSSSANYSVGNQVIYNDVIYTCIKAGTDKTPNANAEYWTNVSALNDSLSAFKIDVLCESVVTDGGDYTIPDVTNYDLLLYLVRYGTTRKNYVSCIMPTSLFITGASMYNICPDVYSESSGQMFADYVLYLSNTTIHHQCRGTAQSNGILYGIKCTA